MGSMNNILWTANDSVYILVQGKLIINCAKAVSAIQQMDLSQLIVNVIQLLDLTQLNVIVIQRMDLSQLNVNVIQQMNLGQLNVNVI